MSICISKLNKFNTELKLAKNKSARGIIKSPQEALDMYSELLDIVDKQLQDGGSEQSLASYLYDSPDTSTEEYAYVMDHLESMVDFLVLRRVLRLGARDSVFPSGTIGGTQVSQWFEVHDIALSKLIESGGEKGGSINGPLIDTRTSKSGKVVEGETLSDGDADNIEFEYTPDSQEDGEERAATDIGEVFSKVLGKDGIYLQEEIKAHIQEVVAQHWIDNAVQNGKTRGAKPLTEVIDNMEAHLSKRLVARVRAASVGEVVENGNTVIVYEESMREALDKEGSIVKTKTVDTEDGPITIEYYEHKSISIVPADSNNPKETKLLMAIASVPEGSKGSADPQTAFNLTTVKKPTSDNITIKAKFNTKGIIDRSVDNSTYFDYVLLTNLHAFFNAYYPGLSTAYETKHRVSYSTDDNAISGMDQASKMFMTHIIMTPRLTMDSKRKITKSYDAPYLTTKDIIKVEKLLSGIPRDLVSMQAALQDAMSNTNLPAHTRSVATSVYLRFFSNTDYTVYDHNDVPTEYRSYVAMETKEKHNHFESTAEYVSSMKGDSKSHINHNEQLADSVSTILTTFASAVDNIAYLSRNGVAYTANPLSGDIKSETEDNIQQSTMQDINGKMFTKENLFKKAKVTLAYGAQGKSYTVKYDTAPGTTVTLSFSRAKILQDKDISHSMFPIQLNVDKSELMTTDELVNLLLKLNYPVTIANAKFLTKYADELRATTEFRKVPADVLQNQFVMANIFLLEANRENSSASGKLNTASTTGATAVPIINAMRGHEDAILSALNMDNEKMNTHIAEGKEASKTKVASKLDDVDTTIKRIKAEQKSDSILVQGKLRRKSEIGVQQGRTLDVNQDSLLAQGKVKRKSTTFQTGMTLSNKYKDNASLTRTEKMHFYIEQGFMERLRATNFKSAGLPIGNMADKGSVPLSMYDSNGHNFMPVKNDEFDEQYLIDAAYASHSNYMKNTEKAILTQWNEIVDTQGMTVSDLATAIRARELSYADIKAEWPINSNVAIVPKKVPDLDVNGNEQLNEYGEVITKTIAVIPDGIIQNINIFKNEETGKKFIEANKHAFRQNLVDIGYSSIHPKYVKELKKLYPNISAADATDIVFDSYFYNAGIIGEEELRLHTGGFMQFKNRQTDSKYSTIDLTNGMNEENVDAILKETTDTVVSRKNGKDENGADIIQELTIGQWLDEVGMNKQKRLEAAVRDFGNTSEITYTIGALSNTFGHKTAIEARKARAELMYYNELDKFNSGKYKDQSKRNSMLGTGIQKPRLVRKGEAGLFLTPSSKGVIFDDPVEDLFMHGIDETIGQDIFDAVQISHPLYALKLNNSIGKSQSNFELKGTPIKDITLANDENGWHKDQKKATFPMLVNEFINKGSGKLYRLLVRMNEAVTFNVGPILVPRVDANGNELFDAPFVTTVSTELFLKNGENLGMVKVAKTGEVVHINEIRHTKDFMQDLAAGKYLTNKLEQEFDNMQELWEYFKSHNNDNAWNQVGEIIGSFAGGKAGSNIKLTDATYPLRDAYIEKAGFLTQEKTGNKKVVPKGAFEDAAYTLENAYDEVSNEHHGIILNAYHDPDTTSSYNSNDGHEYHDNRVSLITQIISANIAQGVSQQESSRIYNSLGALSDTSVRSIKDDVTADAFELGGGKVTEDQIKAVLDGDLKNDMAVRFVKQAFSKYAVKILRKTLKTKSDSGIAGILVEAGNEDFLSFDLKQILPLLQSSLNAEMNRETVRHKFYGGQYVVAPSHGLIESFDIHVTDPKQNESSMIAENISSEDLNYMLYNNKKRTKAERLLQASSEGAPTKFTSQDYYSHSLADKVIVKESFIVGETKIEPGIKTIAQLTELLTPEFKARKALGGGTSRYNFVGQILADEASPVQTRLSNFRNRTSSENRLRWQRYTNALGEDSMDTDEYKSFKIVRALTGGKTSILRSAGREATAQFNEFQALHKLVSQGREDIVLGKQSYRMLPNGDILNLKKNEVMKPSARTSAVRRQYSQTKEIFASAFDTLDEETKIEHIVARAALVKSMIPRGIAKEYFQSQNSDMRRTIAWSSADEAAFNEYLNQRTEQDPQQLITDIETFAKASGTKLIRAVTQKYHKLMRDPKQSWSTKPAEFYMPPMHGKAYFIKDGTRMTQILGKQEQPDINKLVSLGLINSDEAFEMGLHHVELKKALNAKSPADLKGNPMRAIAERLNKKMAEDDTIKLAVNKYKKDKDAQESSMQKYFRDAVTADYADNLDTMFSVDDSVEDVIVELEKRQRKLVTGSQKYRSYTEVIRDLKKHKAVTRRSVLKEMLNKRSDKYVMKKTLSRVINSTVNSMVANFPSSLEFITARIPAQGKQSYISAVTKDFIFSSQNSCYGPLEMLTITGADYDIDKQNMMTWEVDTDGTIIHWENFLDKETGEVSDVAFRTQLKKKLDAVDAENANFKQTTKTLKNTAMKKRDIRKNFEARYKSATKNYVVYNLLKTIKDPKNAIEAGTPVEMGKPKSAMKDPDITGVFDSKTIGSAMSLPGHALPFNPYTMADYERINMDGKVAVGMYATGLKSYLATYYAWLSADNDFEASAIALHSQHGPEDLAKLEDADPFALQFIHADGSVQNIYGLSDTENYLLENGAKDSSLTAKVKAYQDELDAIDPLAADAMEQEATVINRYVDAVGTFYDNIASDAAWADLSALLSAATDNAKELVLGKIGANGTTNSYIATMVKMGVDLRAALQLINDPDIAKLVKEVDESNDLIKTKDKFQKEGEVTGAKFTKLLTKAADKTGPTSAYNRLLPFVRISDEFTLVAKMLSINGGLVNSAFATWKFIGTIEDGINDVLKKGHSKKKGAKLTTFDLQKFIKAVSEPEGDKNYVQDIIKEFSKFNTAINVPYVLMKNAHYFGQFSGLFMAKNVRDSISSVYSATEQLIATESARGFGKINIKEGDFNRIADYIHGIGVQRYFEDTGAGEILVGGHKFNLKLKSNPFPNPTNTGGRKEFLMLMPDIVNAYQRGLGAGNPFIQSLTTAAARVDYATQTPVTIIRTRDLSTVPIDIRVQLKLGLDSIEGTPMYNALFAYNLMTNKGSYSKGSFMTLFSKDKYAGFARYMKNEANMQTIIAAAQSINAGGKNAFLLNNQALIPAVSLNASMNSDDKRLAKELTKKQSNNDTDEDEDARYEGMQRDDEGSMSEEYMDYMSDMEEEMELQFSGKKSYQDHSKPFYDISGINAMRRAVIANKRNLDPSIAKYRSDFVKARQTGIVYRYNEELATYVPTVQEVPSAAIPYNSSSTLEAGAMNDTGFADGFKLQTNTGQSIRILAYVDPDMKENLPSSTTIKGKEKLEDRGDHYIVERAPGKYEVLTDKELLHMTDDGASVEELTADDIKADKKLKTGERYFKVVQNGKLTIMPADEFGSLNIGATLELNGPKFVVRYKTGKKVETKTFADIYKKADGTYTTNKSKGKKAASIQLQTPLESNVTISSFDGSLAKGINSGVSKTNIKTIRDLHREYPKFLEGIADAYVKRYLIDNPHLIEVPRYALQKFKDDIEYEFDNGFSNLEKVAAMLDASNILSRVLKDHAIHLKDGSIEAIITTAVKNHKHHKLRILSKQLLSNPNELLGTSLGTVETIFKHVGVSMEPFNEFIRNEYLALDAVDAYVSDNGDVIITQNSLEAIENKVQESKVIKAPEHLQLESSRKVSGRVLTRVVRMLNKAFPGVKVVTMSSTEIEKTYGKKYKESKGFVMNGEVVINTSTATLETPLHEFMHIYLNHLKIDNNALYANLMNKALNHEYSKTVRATYGDISKNDLAQETFVQLLALRNQGKLFDTSEIDSMTSKLDNSKGMLGKVLDFFSNLINKAFNTSKANVTMDDSLSSAMDKLGDAIIYGKGSILESFDKSTRNLINMANPNYELDIAQAKKILLDKGFIQKVCV